MKEVRVGIIGMGIGRPNARALAKNPRGRVVALCDLDTSRMDDFAKELPEPVTQFTDYKKMCAWDGLDAVFVGTPNQMHVPMALEAVKRGKHVLVTKPLADGVRAADKLVTAAEAAGVVNMMSLSTRFNDPIQYLGRLARAGGFGELYYGRARSIRRSGIPAWNLGFIKAGGGAFRDMGVHVLDAIWWILGLPRPVGVSGVAGAKFGPRGLGYWEFKPVPEETYKHYASDDYAGGIVRFENGAGVIVESFWASHQPQQHLQFELFGTEAGAVYDPLTIYRTVDGNPEETKVNFGQKVDAWDRLAGHFIDCILDGVECAAPLRHGLIVQQMLEAMLTSAEKGREVKLGVE